jgi:hypothetical protein
MPLAMFGVIILLVCAGPACAALGFVLGRRGYRTWRARRSERRAQLETASAELRARSMMSELCPNGWRAQITVFEREDEVPETAPRARGVRVALDWAELSNGQDEVAVMRRVWAPTIADALDAMVADRQTDETLEQIEKAAGLDAAWPDL